MKYFSIPNGRVIYIREVQGPQMTISHIFPYGVGLQEYDCNQSPVILSHISVVIKYPFSYSIGINYVLILFGSIKDFCPIY